MVRNTRRSLVTGFAIFLGIGVLVAVRGFINGFQRVIVLNIAEGRVGALSVHNPKYLTSEENAPLDLDLPGDAAFGARLRAVKGVVAAAPRIAFSSMVNVGDETSFAQVTAVDPELDPEAMPHAADNVLQGRPVQAPGEACIGYELARALKAKLGDTVTFLTSDRDGVLNGVDAKLVGLIAFKTPGDKRIATLALPTAGELLRMNGRVTEWVVRVPDAANEEALHATQARLAAALHGQGEVSTWRELASYMDQMLGFQNLLFGIIGFVFIAVVLIGITNTMLMNVLERVREIGTLMSLGVKRKKIVAMFLIESATLGLMGGVLGAAAGALVTAWLNERGIRINAPGVAAEAVNVIRPVLGAGYVVFAVFLASAGATVSAVYPASKAAQMRPVEALSHV